MVMIFSLAPDLESLIIMSHEDCALGEEREGGKEGRRREEREGGREEGNAGKWTEKGREKMDDNCGK